jgi:hypothetical protein
MSREVENAAMYLRRIGDLVYTCRLLSFIKLFKIGMVARRRRTKARAHFPADFAVTTKEHQL